MNLDTLSPEEALKLFKRAELAPLQLMQLLQGLAAPRIHEALEFLNENPDYNAAVRHYARNIPSALQAAHGLECRYDPAAFAGALERTGVPSHCQKFYKEGILNQNAAMWVIVMPFVEEPVLLNRFLAAYRACSRLALAS